ncbi:MAG: TetR/AcrR family transcriptional regulator [Planctomycetota bacterium]
MRPGPAKSFDPEEALQSARDLFWRHGYDGTGIRDLEEALGIGRKSLYDTFGSKRELYLRAIGQYAETVIGRICSRLESTDGTPLQNLERVLDRLSSHHGSDESLGCLLGVAMGQVDAADDELADAVRVPLRRLEGAFERVLRRAQDAGEVRTDARPRDVARQLVALTQGMALMGRLDDGAARPRSVARATLDLLRS